MVICTMIRIELGICDRMTETNKPENAVTAITANDMTKATDILDVTASAEQTPSTCNAMGLSLTTGSNKSSLVFAIRFVLVSHYPETA